MLSQWQGESGEADLRIFSFDDPDEQVVRLILVSGSFPDLGAVRIYTLGKSDLFPFRSSIATATPRQWDKIQSGADLIPRDWRAIEPRKTWPADG